jgi:hypothetical protein
LLAETYRTVEGIISYRLAFRSAKEIIKVMESRGEGEKPTCS